MLKGFWTIKCKESKTKLTSLLRLRRDVERTAKEIKNTSEQELTPECARTHSQRFRPNLLHQQNQTITQCQSSLKVSKPWCSNITRNSICKFNVNQLKSKKRW